MIRQGYFGRKLRPPAVGSFYSIHKSSLPSTYAVGSGPTGIAIDASGNIWVVNSYGGDFTNGTITELNSSGTTITYTVGNGPENIAIDASGNVWVTNSGSNTVTELNASGGTIDTYAVGNNPYDIAIDDSGDIWVSNASGNTVTKIIGVAKGPQYWPYAGPVWP